MLLENDSRIEKTIFSNRWCDAAFCILLLIGLYLRLSNLHYPINNPEASRDYLVANHIITHHEYPLMGPWNGVFGPIKNSPLYYYILAGFLLVKNNIMFLGIMNVFLQLATGGIIYVLARKMFNGVTGLLAAGFFLFSRLNLVQSSEMWQPYLMQPFVNASFLLMFFSHAREKPFLLLAAVFTFFFAAAIHNSVFSLAPIFLTLAFLIARAQPDPIRTYRNTAMISCISLLVWWTPVAFSLAHTKTWSTILQSSTGVSVTHLSHVAHNIMNNIGLIFFHIRYGEGLAPYAAIGFVVTATFLFAGYCLRESRAKSISLLVLIFMMLQTIVLASFIDKPLQPHYFTPLFGIFFVIIAEQIRWFSSRNFPCASIGIATVFFLLYNFSGGFNFIRFGIIMHPPSYTASSAASLLSGILPIAVVAYPEDGHTARQIESAYGVRDAILYETYNIQKRERLAPTVFSRMIVYKDLGVPKLVTDAPFWVMLENKTHMKLTRVDDLAGNSYEQSADPRYAFLVCEYTSGTDGGCIDTFNEEQRGYLLMNNIYHSFPFSVYLAKQVP